MPDEPVFNESDRVTGSVRILVQRGCRGNRTSEVCVILSTEGSHVYKLILRAAQAQPAAPITACRGQDAEVRILLGPILKESVDTSSIKGGAPFLVKSSQNASAFVQKNMTEMEAEFLTVPNAMKIGKSSKPISMTSCLKWKPAARADSNMWENRIHLARADANRSLP